MSTAVYNAEFYINTQKEQGVLDATADEKALADCLIVKAIPDFNGK